MSLPDRTTWPRWARAASSAWVVSPLVVFALLIGAFFAYGAYTRSQPTHYARGGDSFAVIPSPTPSGSPTLARRHRNAAKPHGRPQVAQRVTSANHASGQTSDAGHVPAPTTAPTQPTGPAYPTTGTYGLRVAGEEHVKFGPFSACSNTFPTSSSLVVQPASGEPNGSFDFDTRFYPSKANKHDERHIYRYAKGNVTLSYEQATVTCGGIKQSSTVNFSPEQERVQLPLSTGATWKTDGGDSGRTEHGTFQVVGQQTLDIAGHSYDTWIIDAHISMSGDESGTRDQRWWWSPDLAMPVKWHESLSGQRSGANYSENVTVTVVTLP